TPSAAYKRSVQGQGRVNAYNFLTDTRIPRPGPDENAWRVESLREVFESAHPYADNSKISKTFTFPGAKYVKLVVEKYDVENGYDLITLKDPKGSVIEKITGSGQNYESDYSEGNSIT